MVLSFSIAMGLKESLAPNTPEKTMITAFMGEMLVDTIMTNVDLTDFHGQEVNILGGMEMVNHLGLEDTSIIKLFIASVVVTTYAAAAMHPKDIKLYKSNIRLYEATQKAMDGALIFMGAALSVDANSLAMQIISHLRF